MTPTSSGSNLEHNSNLIFIDTNIDNYQALVSGIENADVVLLDSSSDGIEQITEQLANYSQLDSIQIISHGEEGNLQLGNTFLNQSSLADYTDELAQWSNSLNSDGDLLFYGCNLATGADGLHLVEQVSQLTGADVAASNDLTGHSSLGGDWILEVTTDKIETPSLVFSTFDSVLATYNGNEYQLTSTGMSWREAQAEAQSLGGNLVTINDLAEQRWLRETFGDNERLWIGLSDRDSEGDFQWVSGSESNYRNFLPNQPDNFGRGEDFVTANWRANRTQWNDVSGLADFRGIIEIGPDNPSTTQPEVLTYNGNEYRLTSEAASWQEAQAEARSLGGNLVTVNNSAEQEWLQETFGADERLWIGLSDRDSEGDFQWVSGETSSYRNFAPNQPDNFGRGEDFVTANWRANSPQWNDVSGLANFRGIIEISRDEPIPNEPSEFSLELSSVTVDEGAASIDLTVNRVGSTQGVVSVDYQTSGQTAVALEDFIPVEGTLTFGDGQESMTIRIPIVNDSNIEEDETFAVQLSNPTNGATLGTERTVIAIEDNDQIVGAGTITFTGPMAMVNESSDQARIRVARVGGSEGTVTVDYITSNDGASAGEDYTATSGRLTFEAGITEQFITVPIINDSLAETRETFFLTIDNPVGGAVIGTESIMVAINDDDSVVPPPEASGYRYVRLVANSEVNGNPWTSMAELNLFDENGNPLEQATWTLESVNSEETAVANNAATNAFDGNSATIWHTEWAPPGNDNDPKHAHEIVIDLEGSYDISGFSYLPRQDASQNGQIADYVFYVSNDGVNWGTPVAAGTLQNTKSAQVVRFEDFDSGDLISGLIGHWKLNETLASSPVLDSSGISSNGTANNFTGINGPYNAAPIFSEDNPRSWDFDGVDDYISIAGDPDLNLSNGAFTQSVWINSDSTDNAYHGILGNQNGAGVANRYPGIWVYEQNKIHAGFGDGTNWNRFTTDSVLKPDAWNHVVVSFDGTTYKAFVNGEEVFATDDFAGRKPIALDSFDIGRVDNYFEGQIDDVRIYNRGLNDREIQSLYQAQPGAAQVGSWSEIIEFPNIPVSAASLPNGKIVTWSSWDRFQFAGNRFDRTYTSLFDTRTQEVSESLITDTNHDMFCPGTVMLPDGRVMVNGGGGDTKFTSVYDFTTNTWSYVDSMEYGRWYNVSVTLGDGSVFTLGGNRSNGRQGAGELWTEETGWRTLSGAPIDPISSSGDRGDEHPQMFAAPNGKVFIAGPSSTMYWYDVSGDGSYTEAGTRGDDTYSQNGLTVMYDEGKLLRAGGQSTYSGGVVTDVAYDIDINNGDRVTVDKQDPMNYKRSYATGVVMADGQVFVVGGSERAIAFRDDQAVYRPETWNPDTGEWTLLAQQEVARTYHSVALLQPDGRVFVGGGGLCGNCDTNHPDAEIYTPAYLYNEDGTLADRPVIGSGPDSAGYGQNIEITIDNDMPITEFNLVRLSSVTHSVNTDQRFLSVDFTANGNSYQLATPESGNVAPPGYYMLFAMNDKGVPSEAKMIQLG